MMIRTGILLILICSTVTTSGNVSAATDIHLTQDEMESVFRGNVIVRELPGESKKGRTIEAIALFNTRLENIYNVLLDFEKYHMFIPDIASVDVLERNRDTAVMNYTLRLPLGIMKKYRLHIRMDKNDQTASLKWNLIEWPGIKETETIRDTTGYWILKKDRENSNKVLVLYHVYTDPGYLPWGFGWIVDFLAKRSAPNVVKKTRARVYEIQK